MEVPHSNKQGARNDQDVLVHGHLLHKMVSCPSIQICREHIARIGVVPLPWQDFRRSGDLDDQVERAVDGCHLGSSAWKVAYKPDMNSGSFGIVADQDFFALCDGSDRYQICGVSLFVAFRVILLISVGNTGMSRFEGTVTFVELEYTGLVRVAEQIEAVANFLIRELNVFKLQLHDSTVMHDDSAGRNGASGEDSEATPLKRWSDFVPRLHKNCLSASKNIYRLTANAPVWLGSSGLAPLTGDRCSFPRDNAGHWFSSLTVAVGRIILANQARKLESAAWSSHTKDITSPASSLWSLSSRFRVAICCRRFFKNSSSTSMTSPTLLDLTGSSELPSSFPAVLACCLAAALGAWRLLRHRLTATFATAEEPWPFLLARRNIAAPLDTSISIFLTRVSILLSIVEFRWLCML
ncbi:hypothetical protein KC326_g119 [Hortaea werneckii]|nr:hypothetical protein KC326_g119 [Hortaea werneckii]